MNVVAVICVCVCNVVCVYVCYVVCVCVCNVVCVSPTRRTAWLLAYQSEAVKNVP